jgi:hypothetical protein
MSIEGFGYKEQVIGDDTVSAFTFDFKIFDVTQLKVYIQDGNGNIVTETDGSDTSIFSSVVFDSVDGGGTVTLINPLANTYVMSMFLANDYPDQPTSFPNQRSFTLEAIEASLDYIATWGQRIAFLAQRAVRLHDLDDIDGFDMRLPQNLSSNPNATIIINSTGDGWEIGPSFDEFAADVTNAADAAEASAAAAAASQTAASSSASSSSTSSTSAANALAATLAAIASAPFTGQLVHTGPFAAIAPNANLDLPGEITDHTVNTQVDFIARIKRGTSGFSRQEFSIFYRNSAWEIAIGSERFNDSIVQSNVTFTVNSGTGQINAAVANDGGSNAVIDLFKMVWPS